QCLSSTLSVAGGAAATQAGTWKARFVVNGAEAAAQTFDISAPAQSALTLAGKTQLPVATSGVAYTYAFVVTGGSGPYRWEIASGQTPAGLTLASGGTLSGTTTAAGTYNFAVKVTDNGGNTLTRGIGLSVSGALPRITIQRVVTARTAILADETCVAPAPE